MNKTVIILIPVYNDFASLEILISKLEKILADQSGKVFSLIVIDDGSVKTIKIPASKFFSIDILRLRRNLGHQKALAIGLSYIHQNKNCDEVLIMDGDGEDQPEDISGLLKTSAEYRDQIIFAHRKSRQAGLSFAIFYFLYKLLFRCLTGKRISSGNFMIIPKDKLDVLVYYSEIWSHLSAGIIKSGLAFTSVAVKRGQRYAESSKMNFVALVLHGLGAISVFLEQVAARLFILSFILIAVSVLIILAVVGIKYFTALAIPGWASTIFSSMLIILLQGLFLSLFTIFLFLSSQSQRKLIPAYHYKEYLSLIETIPHA